ncbi:MAG TPA: phosphotransferase family protein [Caulobacteraceae bacterium]|jgi:aminoglycoside phosphotransferase (APT) family kinase protein|nr:phosphotransferase family protein [Caulobacteraceae bacterium]
MSVSGDDETGLTAGLAAMVRRRFGETAELVGLERLSGGASQELWSFDVETAGRRLPLILRRNPDGFVQRESAAGMETEARLIGLARAAGAPAPEVVHVCEPTDGLGRGYVMERLSGETIARRILRDPAYAAARPRLARQIGAAAARIHAIDVASAGPLRVSSPEASLNAAYAGYAGYGTPRPVVEWAFRWLREHLPSPPPSRTVVHGDMRTGNIIVGPEGLVGVLDWEAVHLGDPMEELGWICVTSWRFGEVDRPAGGFGSREELFAGYEAASGVKPDSARVRWWEVMGTLRWGMSCAMFAKEFQAGDRSVERAAIGRRASETAIDLLAILSPRGAYRHA